MSKQSEILFLFSTKSHLIYIGFPYFSHQNYTTCATQIQVTFSCNNLFKKYLLLFYFISNAENL